MQSQFQQPLVISQTDARRLAITCQHLDYPQLTANEANLTTVLRALSYLQLDPVSVVAPSHELVLWSRLGVGAPKLLDSLLWHKCTLFEYWVNSAAIVLTEDYPMHRAFMNAYPSYTPISDWMDVNDRLRQHILELLHNQGPQPTSVFEDLSVVDWKSSGWTAGRNVERMLHFLWLGGEVMVAGRADGQRLWALTDAYLPPEANRTALSMDLAIDTAVEHAVRALGVARQTDVKQYFFRLESRGPLRVVLNRLQSEGRVVPVKIDGDPSSQTWFIHVDTLDILGTIQAGNWKGRTTLLSPFDNLISDRKRTERLWGFEFKNEMYVPKEKRQYGYYVLSILHGDQLVGRIAPRVDRSRQVFCVEGLYLEPSVRPTADLYQAITTQIKDLATFTGAGTIEYGETVPDLWRVQLQRS